MVAPKAAISAATIRRTVLRPIRVPRGLGFPGEGTVGRSWPPGRADLSPKSRVLQIRHSVSGTGKLSRWPGRCERLPSAGALCPSLSGLDQAALWSASASLVKSLDGVAELAQHHRAADLEAGRQLARLLRP